MRVGHMLPNFLLVKLEVVRIGVCRGDNDPNISRNLERKPLQPGLAPYVGRCGGRGSEMFEDSRCLCTSRLGQASGDRAS